ncbi:MAG: methyltransferase domain-containing protein [Gammaproteobacteria bacterium]|nr:methyltransferase domain-containing protein [Gammaproteobacteria bacterium]
MSHETFHLSAEAADVYETQKVVAIFRPLAQATVDQTNVDPHDRVIDVACGTGIVSRVLEEKYPSLARIVGVDLNQSMIEKARSLTSSGPTRIEWLQTDALDMPFEDHSFSLAICQQGLQYFPEKERTLAEIRRVLEPGGRIAITVWSGASPLFLAIAAALETFIDREIAERSLTPFTFNDQPHIESLVSGAGFHDISISRISVDRIVGPAALSIPREIAGNPIAAEVAAEGPAVMSRIVESVNEKLAEFRDGEGFIVPQESYLFIATV